MGNMTHGAIIITSYDDNEILQIHHLAKSCFGGAVSSIVQSDYDCYKSFFIGPHGSKQGRADCKFAEEARSAFIDQLDGKFLNCSEGVWCNYGDTYEIKRII